MGSTRLLYNNYVQYVLQSEFSPTRLIDEPDGWNNDGVEFDRHSTYHGIFTKFTGSLKFFKEDREYIDLAYKSGGVNANLRLSKYYIQEIDGELKWELVYSFLADFKTRKINDDESLSINFNSNKLAETIRSHETDEFEIERTESIDGDVLDDMIFNSVEIKGRSLLITGESIMDYDASPYENQFGSGNTKRFTPITKLLAETESRHNMVGTGIFDEISDFTADNLFYGRLTVAEPDTEVEVTYNLNFEFKNVSTWTKVSIYKVTWNSSNDSYEVVDEHVIEERILNQGDNVNDIYNLSGKYKTIVGYNEGLALVIDTGGTFWFDWIEEEKNNLIVSEKQFYDSSPNLRCAFTHDIIDRLLYIITGEKKQFYSRFLGRINHPELTYSKDGQHSYLANISGLWLRGFLPGTDKYKSLTVSLKKMFESLNAVLCTGIGIQQTQTGEVVILEDQKYFYQSTVVVRLEDEIWDVTEETDASLFFSGLSFGYNDSGEYESSNGLDEPNVSTEWTSPIRKSELKYEKFSDIRADEYAMELTRRKPQELYPEEDTKRDDSIWFLDLKQTTGLGYTQKEWADRLQSEPTGIHDADSWRGFLFTPLQMVKRHAWIFKAGMYPYMNKYIRPSNVKGNPNVFTNFIGETKGYAENESIVLHELDRPKFVSEKFTFKHSISDDLLRLIEGKTKTDVNGELVEVPNVYFKFQFKDKKGVIRNGYLLNFKIISDGIGQFELQLVNENIE